MGFTFLNLLRVTDLSVIESAQLSSFVHVSRAIDSRFYISFAWLHTGVYSGLRWALGRW